MKRTLRLMTVLVVLAPLVFAAREPDLSVLPAQFRGVVLRPDGQTPVEGLPVRVWDAATEKVIFKTRTDENGTFAVPELKEGDHYITIGSVRVDMRLLTARAGVNPQPHGLVVVLHNRMVGAPILLPLVSGAGTAALPQIMSP